MLHDPKFWVAAAFAAFFVLFGKKAWSALAAMLDGRSARIGAELEAAKRLREEAEGVLAAYRKQQAESLREAEEILQRARAEAEQMAAKAQADMQATLLARAQMAQEKIALAERQAIAELRNHVVDITIASAKSLIMESMSAMPGEALVQAAIADIERKVH